MDHEHSGCGFRARVLSRQPMICRGSYAERVVIYSWLYNIGAQSPVCVASSLLGGLNDGIIRVFMNPMGRPRKRTIIICTFDGNILYTLNI